MRNKPESEFLTGQVEYSRSCECLGSCLVMQLSMIKSSMLFHGLQRMFHSFGYSIDSTLTGVQTAIRMFGQDLTCIAHAQYIHNCSSALAM